ncbi:MAG: hypothetical protein Tsb0013_20260 [Phycisphaerales bacterium]
MSLALRRAALGCYIAAVLVLTLWPGLKLPETAVRRPDLIAHAGLYGLLTLLMIGARVGGPPTLGARNIFVGGAITLAIASAAEAAQGLPGINRVAGWDDGAANALGVFAVCALMLLVGAIDDQKRTGSGA